MVFDGRRRQVGDPLIGPDRSGETEAENGEFTAGERTMTSPGDGRGERHGDHQDRRGGALRGRVRTMSNDLLGNNTRWAAVSEVLQLISSTLVVLMVASLLDEASYGVMAGVAALAAIALNLSNLGSHILLLRRGAQGDDLGDAWSRAMTVGVGLPGLLALLLLVAKPFFQPNVDFTIYALFIVAGMPLFWLTELAIYVPIGLGHMKRAAIGRLIVTVCRLGAIGWFVLSDVQDLTTWAWANMASFALSAVLGVGYVWYSYGVGPRFNAQAREDLRPGLPFSVNGVTENVNDQADRYLLLRFEHDIDNGVYSLGGRAIQFAYMPLRMLLRAHDSELFAAGKSGVTRAFRVSARLAPTTLLLGLSAGAAFWVLAPLVPALLGPKWSDEVVSVIRWLAFLPAARAVQYVAGNTLSAADKQWWRFGATAVAALLNLGLNLALLPNGTWRTAAMTTYVSEMVLMASLVLLVFYWMRRESREGIR